MHQKHQMIVTSLGTIGTIFAGIDSIFEFVQPPASFLLTLLGIIWWIKKLKEKPDSLPPDIAESVEDSLPHKNK